MPMPLFLISILLLGAGAGAWAGDGDWNMARERYSCYTSGMTLQELASGGVTVLSHTPATREYCEEAHRWGLKVCPYVSLYKVVLPSKDPSLRSHPFWREVDATRHPEWLLRREDGAVRRPFDEADYPAGFEQSCCNHAELVAAYARGVRGVLEIGADGAFVDNVHPYPKCYGPDRGIHAHEWPDKDNAECYKTALRGVYNVVKDEAPDKVVVLNCGSPSADYVAYGDTLMWESFVWRFGFPTDTGRAIRARRTHDWNAVLEGHKRWKPHLERGASIAPLTYLPDRNTEEENACFAWACAQLCGFDQWTATCARRRDILRRLYRIRAGPPTSELVQAGRVAYREFRDALVVCNPTAGTVEATVPLPAGLCPPLAEACEMRPIEPERGKVTLRLPPESGRVVISRSAAVENLLREVEGQALAARIRLEEMAAERGQPDVAAQWVKRLRDIEKRAAALRSHPSPDAARCRELSLLPPAPEDLREEWDAEADLLARAGSLSRESAVHLLDRPRAAAPSVETRDGGVTMRSAGAAVRVLPEGRRLIRANGHGFELWVAPTKRYESERWLQAARVTDVRRVVDRRGRKRVEGRIVLAGSKTGVEVEDQHGEFALEMAQGSPLASLDLRIVNDGEAHTGYAFLAAGQSWQTDAAGTRKAADVPDNRKVEWVYLHGDRAGGGGVLLTRAPGVGKSGASSYVFAMPREQALAKGQALDLSLTLAPVDPPSAGDPFLAERLENLARHAGLLAGMVTGLALDFEPGTPAAGEDLPVSVSVAGPGSTNVAAVKLLVRAALGRRDLPVTASGALGSFHVAVPADAAVGSGLDLLPATEVTLRGGQKLILRGLRTLALPEPITLEGRLVLRGERPGEVRAGVRLRSARGREMAGRASASLPAGWRVAPAEQEWRATPGGIVDVLFTVGAPHGSRNGKADGTVKLSGPGGIEQEIPWSVKLSPSTAAPRSGAGPKVDGLLDDAAWQSAARLEGFVRYDDAGAVREPTAAWVTWDEHALYVAVRCSESRMGQLRETAVVDGTRNSPDVPRDDSVEVYLCPRMEPGKLVRFAVNCAGARKSEAAGPWESAAAKGDGEWRVEMALPFATLGIEPPTLGQTWGFNVCRNEQRLSEQSCWSCTYGAYAQADRLGWLSFR